MAEPNKSKIPSLHPEILDDISNGPTKNSEILMNPTSLVLSEWTLKNHTIFLGKTIYSITHMSKNLYVIVGKINMNIITNITNENIPIR